MKGRNIAGGSGSRGRVKSDFYATDPEALRMLLRVEDFVGPYLEPAVGQGHLAHVLLDRGRVDCVDNIHRGYPGTIVGDFLTMSFDKRYGSIITNPPYSLAQEFVEKSLSLLQERGKVAMFLKLAFLESRRRAEFFNRTPPAVVYVFSDRMATWREGVAFDERGKPWNTTIAHAWFVWQEGFEGEPVIRWL